MHCSLSSFDCCFLTCIQIPQEVGKVVWYSHLFQNFPVCCEPTVKGFSVVNKAEADVFLESPCFFIIQRMLAIWSLIPLPFLNPAWTSGSSRFMYCWNFNWRILSITLLACEMSAIVQQFEHSLALHTSLGLEWKLTPSSLMVTAEFPNLLEYWMQQHHLLGFEIVQLEFHHLH